jgi:hypothetical protein
VPIGVGLQCSRAGATRSYLWRIRIRPRRARRWLPRSPIASGGLGQENPCLDEARSAAWPTGPKPSGWQIAIKSGKQRWEFRLSSVSRPAFVRVCEGSLEEGLPQRPKNKAGRASAIAAA